MRFLRPDDVPAPWIIEELRDPPAAPEAPAWLPIPDLEPARPAENEGDAKRPRVVVIDI